MKLKLVMFAAIGFTFGTVFPAHSQGYIVPNGVTYAGSNPGATIHVIQNPTTLDFTGFSLISQGPNTFSFNPFLDEGVRTFLVSQNDAVSLQPILANSYPELTNPNIYTFANGSPFYLGFFTGSTFPVNGVYSDPLFGWARLVNLNGTIQLLGGALEYGGGGIYVGTQTIIPVPEPGAFVLAGLGVVLLGFRHRRR